MLITPTTTTTYVSSDIFTPTTTYTPYSIVSPYLQTEPALVSSEIFFNPYLPAKPVTVNYDFSRPLISTYETIDTDPSVKNKILAYFYDLARDKWLLDDINDILNYFTYSGGEVKMISKLSDYSKGNIAKDNDDIAEKKVKFITKTLLDRYVMTDILTKFTKSTGTKWVNLPKNEYFVMKFTKEYLIKKIKAELK
jgi:hypothetical protein